MRISLNELHDRYNADGTARRKCAWSDCDEPSAYARLFCATHVEAIYAVRAERDLEGMQNAYGPALVTETRPEKIRLRTRIGFVVTLACYMLAVAVSATAAVLAAWALAWWASR